MSLDTIYLQRTADLAKSCPPSDTAFAVWAIIITSDGSEFTWYSRELWEKDHAEEVAIQKAIDAGKNLTGAIIYSSLEPCSERASKPKSCSALIIEHGFKKAIFGALEWTEFVENCTGMEDMKAAGVEVVYQPITEEQDTLTQA